LLSKGGVPYIYVSANTDNFTMERVKSRPNGFIAKPLKKTDVTTTVALVLNEFEMANKEAKVVEEQGAVDAEVPYFLKHNGLC
jgi:hypothetical protein